MAEELTTEATEAFQVYQGLVKSFMDSWKIDREAWIKDGGQDHVKFQRQSVLALANVAAVLGVDGLMTEEQFIDVCRAMFKQAYAAAQKFG